MKKINVDFRKVSNIAMLGKNKRGDDGFASTGVEVIQKVKKILTENAVIISPEEKVTANTEVDLQMTSEEAVMEVNGEIIIDKQLFFR